MSTTFKPTSKYLGYTRLFGFQVIIQHFRPTFISFQCASKCSILIVVHCNFTENLKEIIEMMHEHYWKGMLPPSNPPTLPSRQMLQEVQIQNIDLRNQSMYATLWWIPSLALNDYSSMNMWNLNHALELHIICHNHNWFKV